MLNWKRVLISIIYFTSFAFSTHSQAQPFPVKPIHIVIGFPPGGAIDTMARILAPKMSRELHQAVVIENKGGAGGVIGMQYVANAEPDGYTLFLGTMGNFSITPSLVKDLPYNVHKDFQPIMQIASTPFLIFANPQFPVKNIRDLIAYAKLNPGKVYFSSSGNGGLPHMAGEVFSDAAGIKMTHVPYKGSAPSITDVIGGQVQLTFESIAIGLPYLNSGRLNVLATTDIKRLAILPEVPSVSETLPGFSLKNWFGLAAPQKTPIDRVNQINKCIQLVLKDPDVLKTFSDLGLQAVGDSSADFSQFIKEETFRWKALIIKANIKAD